ncbi:hypothetical protein [Serratia marcescens]|uniref:Uncharacterized protein n=1 Tax=Serratia marcescens TaxID=615 RepID=A0A9X8VDA0_SERMA|nr:hypothetical protein [Serratia marcescens]MBS3894617.1 hypothetical protein [Serratia marcescens]
MLSSVKQPIPRRALSADELALIEEIKTKELEILDLHSRVVNLIGRQDGMLDAEECIRKNSQGMAYFCPPKVEEAALKRHEFAEPRVWAQGAKIDIQKGIMALIRAVEQPVNY